MTGSHPRKPRSSDPTPPRRRPPMMGVLAAVNGSFVGVGGVYTATASLGATLVAGGVAVALLAVLVFLYR